MGADSWAPHGSGRRPSSQPSPASAHARARGGSTGARAAARRSGPAVASRRRRQGAPAARGPGDPRARGGTARDREEAARGGRSGGHGARGGVPPAAALEGEGKELGEDEKASGKLTMRPNRTKGGREGELDEEGGVPAENRSGRPERGLIRPRDGPNGLRDGRRGCGVRRGRLGHTGSRRDGDGWSEQRRRRSLLARARLNPCAMKEKGMRTRSLQRSRTDKARAEGEVRRRDAWRAQTSRSMGN